MTKITHFQRSEFTSILTRQDDNVKPDVMIQYSTHRVHTHIIDDSIVKSYVTQRNAEKIGQPNRL